MTDTLISVAPFLWRGFLLTAQITLIGIACGTLLGTLIGVGRATAPRPGRAALGIYIHFLRGTPFLVQIYLVYFVLPETGIALLQFSSYQAACLTLSLYGSTYVAEIVRAAIEAVPRGQSEGARALGMGRVQTLWFVILPQAVRMALPALGGAYVVLIKVTAVLSVIGVSELVRQANLSIQRHPGDIMLIFLAVAALYFVICFPVLRFTRWAELRWGSVD